MHWAVAEVLVYSPMDAVVAPGAEMPRWGWDGLERWSLRGVALLCLWCYTPSVPTTRPRYTVTDTGQTAALLDLAQRVWPEITDRRQLLLRLTEAGGRVLQSELADLDARRERQRVGLERAAQLVDVDGLLGDDAWR